MASHDVPFLRSAGITRWLRLDREAGLAEIDAPLIEHRDPSGWLARAESARLRGRSWGTGADAIGVWGNWQPDRFWPC